MIAIPNMKKPEKGEVIAFDGEYAVYTDDDMQVHRYPLIEIDLVRCGECKYHEEDGRGYGNCSRPFVDHLRTAEYDYCSYGERKE